MIFGKFLKEGKALRGIGSLKSHIKKRKRFLSSSVNTLNANISMLYL